MYLKKLFYFILYYECQWCGFGPHWLSLYGQNLFKIYLFVCVCFIEDRKSCACVISNLWVNGDMMIIFQWATCLIKVILSLYILFKLQVVTVVSQMLAS